MRKGKGTYRICEDKSLTCRTYTGPVELPELVATVCWYLLWQRRQLVEGEDVQTAERTARAVIALALNYARATGTSKVIPKINKWSDFHAGQQVLNVDASFSEGEYISACGAIIRDHRGTFIRASTARLEHVAGVVSAEAATLLEGLKLAHNTGYSNLVVRTDNITVVDALNQNEGHSMVAVPVLEDCRSILVDFGKVTIEHCIRESNYVAHELDRWGRANNPFVWDDAPLKFIVKLLADDVTG